MSFERIRVDAVVVGTIVAPLENAGQSLRLVRHYVRLRRTSSGTIMIATGSKFEPIRIKDIVQTGATAAGPRQ